MLWHTHLAFGLLSGLVSLRFLNHGNIYIFFAFVLIGALLPDIDTPRSKLGSKLGIFSKLIKMIFGHRGIIHTIWGLLVLCGLFWFFVNRVYGAALAVGFFSHILIDGLTKKGINFLHPFSKMKIAGFVETGTMDETIVLIVILALVIIMLI